MRLGLGLGVASGVVAVGVIGNASRLEYTAVGPAVNLSARLCARLSPQCVLLNLLLMSSSRAPLALHRPL